jgi:hypothetical protein
MRRHHWLIPLAALIAVAPLAIAPSCGKDIAFHLQSWFDYASQLDAATQLRHGTLYPRWTFAAAYNAGEPRFTFYPPISWLLGGLLTLLLPFAAVPIALAWIALTLAGFAMHRLTSAYTSPTAALLAACLYLANPFMLFSIAARAAYGEIFAAALCPLLIAAMLAEQPNIWAIAFPLAGMALSNVPAGILAGYLFLFLAIIRLPLPLPVLRRHPGAQRRTPAFAGAPQPALSLSKGLDSETWVSTELLPYTLAPIAALALAAIFLLPAIHQRPFIRMADAFPPGLRPIDNLLLHRTLLPGRDDFLLHIQHLTLLLAAATLLALTLAWRKRLTQRTIATTAALALTVLFSLTYLAAPLWRTLPALWIVQFPWRALFILATCMAFATALAFRSLHLSPTTTTLAALTLTAALAIPNLQAFREPCAPGDTPTAFLATLQQHHTPEPTDEYVPAHAHLGAYRPDNPPFWLSPDPTAYAPNSTPNHIDTDPNAPMPAVPANAQLSATPLHLTLTTPTPTNLILNLEDYPNWRITRNKLPATKLPRQDGLIAIALPAGASTVDITWHHAWDELLGAATSAFTLMLWLMRRARERARQSREA